MDPASLDPINDRRESSREQEPIPEPRDYQQPSLDRICCFRDCLLGWYEAEGRHFPWRRASASNYEKIIAEVLLQRTRAEVVATFFPRFLREFPSWKRLSTASEEQLQVFLQPIGLWRRRAASIQALAQEMAKRGGRFPRTREEIEKLPGIGQYIANAVLMFVYNQPQPLLDTNMSRVLERVFGPRKLADIRYDPYLQQLATSVVGCDAAADINWAILDLAAKVCSQRKPRCDVCPVRSICKWAADGHCS